MIIHICGVSLELSFVITEYFKEFTKLVDPDHKVLQTLNTCETSLRILYSVSVHLTDKLENFRFLSLSLGSGEYVVLLTHFSKILRSTIPGDALRK